MVDQMNRWIHSVQGFIGSLDLPLPNFMLRGSLALPDFPGLFKFRIENGFKIEGKAKVIAYSWNDIKGQITPES